MTTASERSRAFLYGLELLEELIDPAKTPGVPAEVRDRARHVLRHYPTASELCTAVEPGPVDRLMPALFDTSELERWMAERRTRRLAMLSKAADFVAATSKSSDSNSTA